MRISESFTSEGVEESHTFAAKERGGTPCLLFLINSNISDKLPWLNSS